MKTIDIEKVLDLKGAIDLLPVTMKDSFSYQQEENGIRCVGPFFIRGRYTTLNEVKDFQDVFEFDVFAANEKLDGEAFKIVYDGYDYTLQDGVTLTLHFTVFGIKDDKEESVFEVDTQEEIIPMSSEAFVDVEERVQTKAKEIESAEVKAPIKVPVFHKAAQEATKAAKQMSDETEIMEDEVKTNEEEDKSIDLSMMEELFEEKDNVITSYSFVVVKKEDSYESIANRYSVDVEALRGVNNNKEIHEKSLIVLPYAK